MMRDPRTLPTIDARTAAARLEGPADGAGDPRPLLVDVREVDEFRAVRIARAALYPLSSFVHRWHELPADRPLIIVCASGSRSASVTAFLLQNGLADVTNLAGGIAAWQRAGLPVRTGPLGTGEGDLS